jgi:hypothetical protein
VGVKTTRSDDVDRKQADVKILVDTDDNMPTADQLVDATMLHLVESSSCSSAYGLGKLARCGGPGEQGAVGLIATFLTHLRECLPLIAIHRVRPSHDRLLVFVRTDGAALKQALSCVIHVRQSKTGRRLSPPAGD